MYGTYAHLSMHNKGLGSKGCGVGIQLKLALANSILTQINSTPISILFFDENCQLICIFNLVEKSFWNVIHVYLRGKHNQQYDSGTMCLLWLGTVSYNYSMISCIFS
jgi:hypothetical protein